MDKKQKRLIVSLITYSIILFAVVTNFRTVINVLLTLWDVVKPVIIGLIIAFVLNVPMRGFEKLFDIVFKNAKRKPPTRIVYVFSLLLAIVSILLVLSIALIVAVPEIINSSVSIYELLEEKIPELLKYLEKHGIDTTSITKWLSTLDYGSLIEKITSGAGEFLYVVIDAALDTVSELVGFLFAFVIALYVLMSKDTVIRRSKKIMYSLIKKEHADEAVRVCTMTNKLFSQYLTGQCIEACILGALITVSFMIFGLPYAGVIGIMTGISAFIPYIGAFVAGFLGAFLILLIDPMQAVIALIVIVVVQFIETQFIYPHVVGGSVGLSPLLTLVAALVGGNLMGLFGIVFFIPLTAVVFNLIKEKTDKHLEDKNIKIE